MASHEKEYDSFEALAASTGDDPRVLRMKAYVQHGDESTYDHCMAVARMSYGFAQALPLQVHTEELVRGALLHDYYLYDWHVDGDLHHGFDHPAIAEANARRDFDVTELEAGIIRTHMWPWTLLHPPRSREAALVCIADKACTLKETIGYRLRKVPR